MTTFLEEIAAGPLDGSLWSAGPAVVVGSVQCASVQCLSVLPHPQMLNGRLSCSVDHAEQGPTHGAMVGPHHVTWTTADAAKAWEGVIRCLNTYCGAIVADGVAYCSDWCQLADKHSPADDYEPLGEVA